MAAEPRASNACRDLVLFLAALQAVPSFAEDPCTGPKECPDQGTSWTSLWYVWLILLTVFLLLICGIGASCVKFCCRKKRPPVQTFPPTAHDLTIIPMDHDSTAHSTVTSYSSVQYPPSFPIPFPFREVDRSAASPPAYSLYAIELPPSYDEAIRMTKPYLETPFASQKLEAPTAEPAAPPPNQELQTLPETSSGNSAVEQEDPRSPEASTEGQPEPH
ncbi:transmembrane protein 52 [Pogona vitticeps]